jgi:ATPase subunit of ABC transporter with duplicated ATPase domains
VSSSGYVEVAHVSHVLPDGRTLLDDVSFRIGEGITAALVGPNGAGKTTLLRLVAGDIQPQSGTVTATGGLGVMRQFIGGNRAGPVTGTTQGRGEGADAGAAARPMVRDLLLSVSPPRVREAAARLDAAELAMMERDDEREAAEPAWD